MWNSYQTDQYVGQIAETTTLLGYKNEFVHAYFARPLGNGPFPGLVLVHHMPGWDELYQEFARRYAAHGYTVMSPDLYSRFGSGTSDDVTARTRAAGGVPDESVVGDLQAANQFLRALPTSNGKVGILGTCSGGRHALLTAARNPGTYDAVCNLWGGRVVMTEKEISPNCPVSPHTLVKDLTAPVLGIFGNEDQNPNPEQVNTLEEDLKKHGKKYEFHRWDGAGHAFMYYDRPAYRQQQAMEAQQEIFKFLAANLQT